MTRINYLLWFVIMRLGWICVTTRLPASRTSMDACKSRSSQLLFIIRLRTHLMLLLLAEQNIETVMQDVCVWGKKSNRVNWSRFLRCAKGYLIVSRLLVNVKKKHLKSRVDMGWAITLNTITHWRDNTQFIEDSQETRMGTRIAVGWIQMQFIRATT